MKQKSLDNDKQVYLFATNDQVLKSIGNSLNEIYDTGSIVIVEKIKDLYTYNIANKIIDKLRSFEGLLLSEERAEKSKLFYNDFDEKIISAEEKLL